MPKKNSQWLDSANAEAVNHGTYVLIKTNLLPPKATVLSLPGQTMTDWDPRGPLAQATWNKIIQEALFKIEYEYLSKAVVLMVVRSPYPQFDPINTNPEFALNAMINCRLISGVIPGQLLYATVGCRTTERGTDFYVGSPAFLAEMLQIVGNTLGDKWKSEIVGNNALTVIHKDQAILRDMPSAPPRSIAVSSSIGKQPSQIRPEASLKIKENYALFKTNMHPPQVGLIVPQTFLPFSLYSAWVREARAIWVDILREACAVTAFKPIGRAIVLVVIKTQSPHFSPIDYNLKALINVLVGMRLITDDSYERLACFVIAKNCDTGGGIDIFVGTPTFVPEMARIALIGLRPTNQDFFSKNIHSLGV